MSKKESSSKFFKNEDLRGLFTLGLLAVVVTIRIQKEQIMITINENSYNVAVFLDVTMFLWSFYAFFMVLGLSEDIVGEKLSGIFRNVSTFYLYFSFAFLTLLSTVFMLSAYPTRTPWALGFLVVLGVYFLLRKLGKLKRPSRPQIESDLKHFAGWLKANLYQLFATIFAVCLLTLMFGPYEEQVFPSFVIGSAALVLCLATKEKFKKP